MNVNIPHVGERTNRSPASARVSLGDDGTPAPRGALTRRSVLVGVGATVAVAGCLGAADDDLGGLDLDAMEFDHGGELIPIEAAPNAFVGEVTAGLFIAVARPSGAGPFDAGSVVVYLCDGMGLAVWLDVEEPTDGELTLEDSIVSVELTLTDEEATGIVAGRGERDSFTAYPATGQGGLYWTDHPEWWGGWIVLDDLRWRGSWSQIPGSGWDTHAGYHD